jgi:hypothetical protein
VEILLLMILAEREELLAKLGVLEPNPVGEPAVDTVGDLWRRPW